MNKTRLIIKVEPSIKTSAQKAATLQGYKTVNEYIENMIERESQKIIQNHKTITLPNDVFDRFLEICNDADPPNKNLVAAAKFAKQIVIN